MGLLVFICVVVLVIVLVRNNAPEASRTAGSTEYMRGYWDGVRDMREGRVKTEERDGQLVYVAQPASVKSGVVAAQSATQQAEPPVPPASTPQNDVITPEQQADAQRVKEHNRRTVINTALYTASLLLTAGILLLAQAVELPPTLRFAMVWLFIFIYYAIGHVLYQRLSLLKPASIAFIGTALVALPIGGLTTYTLMHTDPAICWFVTSLIGAGLFVHSTIRLNSQPLAYVAILSLFSMTLSLPAMMQTQLVWYFVVLLVFGSLMTLAARFTNYLPPQFTQSLDTTSPAIVPLTLLAACSTMSLMNALEISMVLLAGTVYYSVVGLTEKLGRLRTYALVMARVLVMMMLGGFAAYFFDHDAAAIGLAISLAGLGNMAASIAMKVYSKHPDVHHEVLLWGGFWAAIIGQALVGGSAHVWRVDIMVMLQTMTAVIGFMALALLRRPILGIIVLIMGWLLPSSAMSLLPVDGLTKCLLLYFIALMTALLPILLRLIILKRPRLTLPQAWLVYGTSAAWLLPAFGYAGLLALATEGGVPWMQLCGIAAIGTIVTAAALWRERVHELVIGIHVLVMIMVMTLGLHFQMSIENLIILMAWVNAVPLLVLVEWLWQGKGTDAAVIRQLLSASVLVIASLLVLTSIHPAVWLPLVAVCFYLFYRQRNDGYLAAAYATLSLFVIFLLRWFDVSLHDNFTITAWVLFAGFAVVYWLLNQQARVSMRGEITLGFAVAPTGVLGMMVLALPTASLGLRILAWLAVVMAFYMTVLVKRDWRFATVIAHPSAVLLLVMAATWLELPAEFFSIVSLLVLGAFYALSWLAWAKHLKAWRQSLLWSGVGWSMAVTVFASIVAASTPAIILASAMWLLSGGVIIVDAVLRKGIVRLDVGALLVVCGIMLAMTRLDIAVHAIVPWYIWSAAALAISAVIWRWRGYVKPETIGHLVVALALCSLPTLELALGGDSAMKMLFLAEHVLMVVIGLLLGKRLITIWGAVCVTLALIYMLSGYAYALAILAGLTIITAVVIVVVRGQRNSK